MHPVEPLSLPNETLTATTADCTLTVSLTRPAADALQLHYSLRNTSARPLYLCNQLYKTIRWDQATGQAVFAVDPNVVNVQVTDEHVAVGKTVVDVPDWMLVEAPQMPCLTRLAPGAACEETVHLALPLMPYTVYDYSPSKGPVTTRPLVFELGYFLASPEEEQLIRTVRTPQGTAHYTDPFPANEQSLITAGPFAAPAPVVSPA